MKSLGVVRRASRDTKDWIADRLNKRYGIHNHPVWRDLLTTEYEHALQILIEADAMYDVSPSTWMQTQDSFNDLTVRKFVGYLNARGLNGGAQKLIDTKGRLIPYGVILKPGDKIPTAHPAICSHLLMFQERRNTLPGSHPYELKGGQQNRWLTRKERDAYLNDIQKALSRIIHYVNNYP